LINKKNWVTFFTLIVFIVSSSIAFAQTPLTLEESIDIALKNSFVLNIAKEGTKSATTQKRKALTGFLPKFSTSYSYTRLNEEPSFQLPFPPGEMTTGTRNNYNWNIEARQPVFAGGGIIANYMANKIGEDVASVEEKARYQDVVQEVKIAYFDVLRAQRVLEAADQSVKMLAAHRNVADNYFQVGFIAKNDLLQAEVELANGRQTLIRAQNDVDMSKSRFNTL